MIMNKKVLLTLIAILFPVIASAQLLPAVNFKTVNGVPINTILAPPLSIQTGLAIGQGVGPLSAAAAETTCFGPYSCSSNFWASYNGWLGGGGTGITGNENTCIGATTCAQLTTGVLNTALGTSALGHDITGQVNTALGNDAERNSLNSFYTVAIGANALRNGINNIRCIAIGYQTLYGNEMGASGIPASTTNCTDNIAIGNFAMQGTATTTASANNLIGTYAGQSITTGSDNVGSGFQILYNCTTCLHNIAIGSKALYSVGSAGSGSDNVAIGYFAGSLLTGQQNVFIGYAAGQNDISGINNTFLGFAAGQPATGNSNVLLGWKAGGTTLTSGSNNILVGANTDTVGGGQSNEINIGNLLFWNNTSTAVPTLSACGTGSPTVDTRGNNRSGTITAGAGALASCTMTFAGSGYSTWSHCRITSQSAVASFAYSYTLTTLTVAGTSITSSKFDYDCDGV